MLLTIVTGTQRMNNSCKVNSFKNNKEIFEELHLEACRVIDVVWEDLRSIQCHDHPTWKSLCRGRNRKL